MADSEPETSIPATPPRRTPLYDCHRAAGAKMVSFAGWDMPVRYSDVMAEHHAVRSAAGLFDVSHMGEIRVSGAGAEAFLQRLTPNNVNKLKPGRAHYSGLLNERGTYIDDVLVYRLADEDFMVVVNASNIDRDRAWIESQPHPDTTIEDQSARYALLALQGPKAPSILARLTASELESIRYYRFAQGQVAGRDALISRTGYTGEDGFELYCAPEDAPFLWDQLFEVGAADGLVPAGLGARDTLRLEAGMALYGHEIDDTRTPYDAGLGWVVKLAKGEFIGRSALAAQKEAGGPTEHMVGFEVTDKGIAREGCVISSPGEGARPSGVVVSGTWSPTLEKALGIAYVPASLAEPGTELAIAVRKRILSAVVVPLPFYKRA